MATRKVPAAKGKSRRPASFSDLLSKAPKIRNFRRTTLSGILFQSELKGKFVLQTADGIFHELNVKSVEQFKILERDGKFTVVEIQLPSRELGEGETFSTDVLTKEEFADQLSKLPAALSDPEQAQIHLSALEKDSAHPIHQYWQFGRVAESAFKEFDHPFPQSPEARS